MYYFYVQFNEDWVEKFKYGFTKNYIKRLLSSHEQHSNLSKYIRLYKLEYTEKYENLKLYKECDKLISICARNLERYNLGDYKPIFLNRIKPYLVEDGGSTEFITSDGLIHLEMVVLYEFSKLGINVIKEYSESELVEINKRISLIHNSISGNRLAINHYTPRDYQKKIIDYAIKTFTADNNKIYIKLATGGGKTFIVYNILRYLVEFKNLKTIIIVSPLRKINRQNTSKKYTKLLERNFTILNYSEDYDIKKFSINPHKIVTFCSSSKNKEKLLNVIKQLNNYALWFDEAHHTVEQSLVNNDENLVEFCKKSLYTIFTSASPNRKLVLQNYSIFGELCKLISVRELINLGFLCDIKTYIFDIQQENIKIINYIVNAFKEQNKKFGFSFHSRQKNAFNLFRIHVELYNMKETKTKPFLLLGDIIDENLRTVINNIKLDYDFKSIDLYETTEYSIGYVVQQYSMGYDFPKLDFVVFPDNKSSHQDIVQCLGRGFRIYKDKYLSVLIPTFINEQNINNAQYRFKQIINVIKYLIREVEIEFDDIKFDNSESNSEKNTNVIGETYEGVNNIRAKLLELLELNKRFTYEEFVEHLLNNNIDTADKYYDYYSKINDSNNEFLKIRLPENPFTEYENMAWRDVDKDKDKYYSFEECVEKLSNYEENFGIVNALENLDYEQKIIKLNEIDVKFPRTCYSLYYKKFNCFPLLE